MAYTSGIRAVVDSFPAIYAKAREDWAVFQAADKLGAYSPEERQLVVEWFGGFSKLWLMIRPNWVDAYTPDAPAKAAFSNDVDRWLDRVQYGYQFLGGGPLIIAGIVIAGAAGVAGVLWAIGYVKEQNNVSRVINDVASGVLPVSAIGDIRQASGSSFASTLDSASRLLMIGAILYFVYPMLRGVVDES